MATDDTGARVVMPFFLRGVISHLHVEPLTRQEYEAHTYPRIELTNKDLTWGPTTAVYEDQENSIFNHQGDVIRPDASARGLFMSINSVCMSTYVEGAVDITSQTNFASALQVHVHISSVDIRRCSKRWADVSASIRTPAAATAGGPFDGNNAATV